MFKISGDCFIKIWQCRKRRAILKIPKTNQHFALKFVKRSIRSNHLSSGYLMNHLLYKYVLFITKIQWNYEILTDCGNNNQKPRL